MAWPGSLLQARVFLDEMWAQDGVLMTKEELEAFMLTVSQSSDATLDLESRGFSLPDAQGQQIALPDAREEDGACGMWLEKKSPSKVKGWQRRWSVPKTIQSCPFPG